MGPDNLIERAVELFQKAFEAQMRGELDRAAGLYKESLDAYPTAEAHTFLGWTYSSQGDLARAIDECKKAIEVDPDFGNPWNDIGAYLIEMGRHEEAIPWLERAKTAARYDAPHYPRFNLGRAYLAKEMYSRALGELDDALAIRPEFDAARELAAALRRKLN